MTATGGWKGLVERLWEPAIGTSLLAALGLRLLLLPWFSDPYNFWGTFVGTELLLDGHNPFSIFSADPRLGNLNPWGYPALYFPVTVTAFLAAGGDGYLYGIFLRVPSAFFDLGTAILLLRTARLLGAPEGTARVAALAFLWNPFSILVTSVWGTNDPLPVFFASLALYYLVRRAPGDGDRTGLALGLGMALKLYPVLLLPVALAKAEGWPARARMTGLAVAIPLLTSLPFLLADAGTYLGTLLGFAAGSRSDLGVLSPHFSAVQVAAFLLGPLDGRWSLVLAGGLITALVGVYRLVQTGRLSPLPASLLALVLAALLSVRWNENYMLWILPFALLSASLGVSGWRRWALGLYWVPAMVHVLIFNGWYPDPFTGASGPFYWALVSGAPPVRAVALVPPAVAALTIVASITLLALVAWSLHPWGAEGEGGPRRPPPVGDRGTARPRASTALSVALVAALLLGAVVSGLYVGDRRAAVTPSDFASFSVDVDGAHQIDEDFRADLLYFRWVFRGNGSYRLEPDGASALHLDTGGRGGAAYLETGIAASRSVTLTLDFQVLRLDGPGPLVLVATDQGWLGVVAEEGTGTALLAFHDPIQNRTHPLGSLPPGPQEVSLAFTETSRTVVVGEARLVLPGTGDPVGDVRIGPAMSFPAGGGLLSLTHLSLRWAP